MCKRAGDDDVLVPLNRPCQPRTYTFLASHADCDRATRQRTLAQLRRHGPNVVLVALFAGLLALQVCQLVVAVVATTQSGAEQCEAAMAHPLLTAMQLMPPVVALMVATAHRRQRRSIKVAPA